MFRPDISVPSEEDLLQMTKEQLVNLIFETHQKLGASQDGFYEIHKSYVDGLDKAEKASKRIEILEETLSTLNQLIQKHLENCYG